MGEGHEKVTGVLVDKNESGSAPPDARVSHPRFYDVNALFAGILERLQRHKKVDVVLSPTSDELVQEKHEVFKSD